MKGYIEIGQSRFGVEVSPVLISAGPYLTRYILYLGFGCLRLHKFFRSDDNRAPHDHPFSFWTFPLASYIEKVYDENGWREMRVVKAFRVHYRPAEFRHIVMGRAKGIGPFWTIVWATRPKREWGFWIFPKCFIHWRDWV